MAAWSILGTTFNTTNNAAGGSKTVTATPAVGDYIVILAANTGNNATTDLPTDDQGGTYALIDSSFKNSAADRVCAFRRTTAIASAVSTVFTYTTAATTSGGGLSVLALSGMSRFDSSSIKQTPAKQTGLSGSTTPAPVFGATPQSGNPILGVDFNGTNSAATATPRAGYTERFDNAYATPNTGLEIMTLDSGETSATITWGSTVASLHCCLAIEFDASSAAGVGTSSGTATVSGVGSAQATGVGASAGVAAGSAVGSAQATGVGSAVGTATAAGIGNTQSVGIGTSSGQSPATGTGQANSVAIGTASGSASAQGDGRALFTGVGLSEGAALIDASGAALCTGIGTSAGSSTASGVGPVQAPRQYPLAGIAQTRPIADAQTYVALPVQPYPAPAPTTYPLAGEVQDYPLRGTG